MFAISVAKAIRKCSKWYSEKEYRPIKTAIHNCYKLVQKGYVPENQGELENNIKKIDKRVTEVAGVSYSENRSISTLINS